MTILEFYDNEIKPFIDWGAVCPGFVLKANGNRWDGPCVKCPEGKAYIYQNLGYYGCNNPACTYYRSETPMLVVLNGGMEHPKGQALRKLIDDLAKSAGKSVPNHINSEADITAHRIEQELRDKVQKIRNDFLKVIQAFFASGQLGKEYLLNERKMTAEEVQAFEYGFFPDVDKVKTEFKNYGYSSIDIEESGLLPRYWENRLLLVFRDHKGNIVNFSGRSIDPNCPKDERYYVMHGNKGQMYLFLPKKIVGKSITLFEGPFDALAASYAGIPDVAALGGKELYPNLIQALQDLNPSSITLCLDNDGKGAPAALKIAKTLAKTSIKVFIVPPKNLGTAKDADELLRAEGVDKLREVLRHRLPSAKYIARDIYHKVVLGDIPTEGEQEDLLDAALEYSQEIINSSAQNGILDEVQDDFLDKFAAEIYKLGQIGESDTERYRKKIQDHKDKSVQLQAIADYEKRLKEWKNKAAALLAEEKLDELDRHYKLKPILDDKTDYEKFLEEFKPYTLENLQLDLCSGKEGLATGYKELDECVDVPNEAITLIAGRPGHGKTTFMLNMLLNMLTNYPDKNFYFFSYEETLEQITPKLINILSKHKFDTKKNLGALRSYLKRSSPIDVVEQLDSIENGKKVYQELTNKRRLIIIKISDTVQDLSEKIKRIRTHDSQVGAVFVDYVQKIKNKKEFGTRQLELQKTSELILETAQSASIPIILGAQLKRNKDNVKKGLQVEDLRECGDLEQDASLILGVYNSAKDGDKASDNFEPSPGTVDLNIYILKNRNGQSDMIVDLEFDGAILQIKDPARETEIIPAKKFEPSDCSKPNAPAKQSEAEFVQSLLKS